MHGGSYIVINLFKQKVVLQKTIFLLPWHYTTIFFVIDALTIFSEQMAGCETYSRIVLPLFFVTLHNNNTAINFPTFTSSYGSRRFSACDHWLPTEVFLHPGLLF